MASFEGSILDEKPQVQILDARDWYGDDDPADPRNYSLARKIFSTAAYSGLAFVTTFAASLYSAGIDEVKTTFHCSEEVAILPLSLYNAGLAFGPLIGSPMSEQRGRKAVVLITTPLFALFTLGAGFSPTVAGLIICRFIAGVFAAPAVSNTSAIITDYTASRYRAVTMGIYYTIPTFGANLGPLVGGFVVQAKGWRWTQWTTLFFLIAFYIPVLFTKETYKKTILQRRARALKIEGPPQVQRSLAESVHYFMTILLLRPAHMLFTEPIVFFVCLYGGFVFGLIYTFVTASPWIYQHYYGFDTTGQSLSFLGLVIGTAISPIPLTLLDHYIYQPRLRRFTAESRNGERFPPEHRLYPAMIAAPMLPAFLFTFAWVVRPTIHWIVPVIFQGLTMTASIVVYAPSMIFMFDAYGPLFGASAGGAAMLCRYSLSTAFPLFARQMYMALGVGWATSILAFFAVFMAPVPWMFFRYGANLRARIKYETSR